MSFYFGGSKLVRFLAKIEHIQRKLLYYVNRHKTRSTKCAKIGLSKTSFYDKSHLNLTMIGFHLKYLFLWTSFDNYNLIWDDLTQYYVYSQNTKMNFCTFDQNSVIKMTWWGHGGISITFFLDHFSSSFLGQKC